MPTSSPRKAKGDAGRRGGAGTRRPAANPFLPPDAALNTPGEWLRTAEMLYKRHHLALGQVATNAHDEALYLILRALDLPLDAPPEVLDRRLTSIQRREMEEMFRRRIVDRVPAAYLTREAWLGDDHFYVDERVIIPRSYFVEIIPTQLADWLPAGRKIRRAIDVCTGSGCLAILLAHQFAGARVDACDLSVDALEVAKINVRQHRLERRVRLFASDVLDAVPPVKYDLILSNPPYEPSRLVDAQAPEFAAEPRMAHDGGRDGLEIIRKLLRQSASRLEPHGIVAIEVGGLRMAIEREFRALDPHWLYTEDGSDCVVLFQAGKL